MAIIDFTEIPAANTNEGQQDTFELFARDFLAELGFEVVADPNRGADNGKDVLVEEVLIGPMSKTKKRWIVSCKHFAASGKSVGLTDEIDVKGRVDRFDAKGFLAFYSTLPSSGLAQAFERLKDRIETEVWDWAKIEKQLMTDGKFLHIFERYFPKSYLKWKSQTRLPTKIVDDFVPLVCNLCGKDLLEDKNGIVAFVHKWEGEQNRIQDIYWACKGSCDRTLQRRAFDQYDASTSWEGINDLSIPLVYARWVLGTFNNLRSGRYVFSDQAFEKLKDFTLGMAQIVFRETNDEQWGRIRTLSMIPSYLGGLGES